jgi:hypothetical protein
MVQVKRGDLISNKITRNSVCPCGSGLKFKECCGKGTPLKANTLSFLSSDRPNASEFEKALKVYTGNYPDDYFKPVTNIAPIFYILMDESKLNNHYSVSGIVVSKQELDSKKFIKPKLEVLAENYNVDSFHFTEIFGRSKVLKSKTNDFIEEYSKLVMQIEMIPFSICKTKAEVDEYQNNKGINDEQIFISLQWQLMIKILKFMIWKFGSNFIVHMWREQENLTVEKRLLHQENIVGLLETFPFSNISIYRHYEIFMKTEILYSSLSDLVAYFTTRVQSRNDSNMPEKKIIRDNYEIIKLISKVFKEHQFIDVSNLDRFNEEVTNREGFRKHQGN